MKKRSFEVEANRWEEMKREGKVDDCRLWLPLEVEGECTLALYDTGTTRSFCDEEFIVDDREWVKENTADMREEVKASANELKEIDEIVGPALDKNKKLPKSAVCNRPDAGLFV